MPSAAVLLLLAWCCGVGAGLPLGYRPNFVFVLTDDQDTLLGKDGYSKLGSIESQPMLQKLLGEEGTRVENFLVHTPICCPSRTEYFTGRYFHNVKAQSTGCMFANTTHAGLRDEGMFGLLTTAGYETGIFGKVTNDQTKILPLLAAQGSATYIDSPVKFNDYYGDTYYHLVNGSVHTETLNKTAPRFGTMYQTTQLGNRTLEWLDVVLRGTKPFFLYLGPHAPHFPATPAPWYESLWDSVAAPVTPNFNASSPDKTVHIRQNPPLTDTVKCWEDQHFRDRWATLRSVEEVVDALIAKLDSAGVLDRTYIIYTADHGYKFGQWRVASSKMHPYETDIRVPFYVRGPGVKANVSVSQLAGNVDVLPTLLELAGVDVPSFVDGKSMVSFLAPDLVPASQRAERAASWRQAFLGEYKSLGFRVQNFSPIWSPPDYAKKCGGGNPKGPDPTVKSCTMSQGVGDGNCYLIDDRTNSWRALRVMNETHNLQYIEYDSTFTWQSVDFHELYDLRADPYQLTNIYQQQSPAVKAALSAEVARYYSCKGQECP